MGNLTVKGIVALLAYGLDSPDWADLDVIEGTNIKFIVDGVESVVDNIKLVGDLDDHHIVIDLTN